MCEIDWKILLEYLKVILSWPPIALVIAMLLIPRGAIGDFLKRVVQGNFFGQEFKAVLPTQQTEGNVTEDGLTLAAKNNPQTQQETVVLPAELANEPYAQEAVNYVRNNPVETVIEYRRLSFNYNAERLFASIYGTQISLLEFLASNPETPSNLGALVQFHDDHQRRTENTNYQIRDYMNFLISQGVVKVSGEENAHQYYITEHGIQFLSYIKANYPLIWNTRMY